MVATEKKKRPCLSDPRWLKRQGLVEAERVGQWVLWALPVGHEAMPLGDARPRFAPSMHEAGEGTDGRFTIRWDDQRPFNLHWAEEVAESLRRRGREVEIHHIASAQGAQTSRSPLGTYSLERDGELVCHHLTTDGATERMLHALDG